MLSLSSASMNLVIPSSKLRAILCGTLLIWLPPSDVIDVDDVVDVVVLQNDFFGFDQEPLICNFERVEGNPEIGVDDFVAIAERLPVEAQVDFAVVLGENFDV